MKTIDMNYGTLTTLALDKIDGPGRYILLSELWRSYIGAMLLGINHRHQFVFDDRVNPEDISSRDSVTGETIWKLEKLIIPTMMEEIHA